MYVCEYSAFAAPIDLLAAYPGGGKYATRIKVVTVAGGVLQVTTDRGTAQTLTAFVAQEELTGRFKTIGTATTCGVVRVFWDD